jgi:hypothetical protein
MTHMPEIDETLLTAFALGELDMDPDERERVAAHVGNDTDARRFVEDVRESAGLVVGALEMELVDGLAEFQHEMIERRLSELHGEPQPLRFRPATLRSAAKPAALARAARFRRWLPTLASAAASTLIVAGTLAFFLRFNRHDDFATNTRAGSPSAAPAAKRPSTPPPVANARHEQDETDVEPDLLATDDEGPIEDMVDPKSVPTAKAVKKKAPAKAPAPTAVASTVAKKPAAAPVVTPAVTAKPKTMRSPDAREVKRTAVASAMIQAKPASASKPKAAVNASPVRDGQALDKTANTVPTKDAAAPTKLFENKFRTVADRPRSSFRVPPADMAYKHVKKALDENRLPAPGSARVDELLNHYTYSYPPPTDSLAVAVSVEVATCPWEVNRRLARIALKARDARPDDGGKPVATDLTANVHFNAAATSAWRLIGYENGQPAPNGTFPASDLAAGRAVTALYEIIPVAGVNPSEAAPSNLFTVSLRYRDTTGGQRETITAVAKDTGAGFDRASEDFRFASAVATFGMLLRDSTLVGKATFADVMRWANESKGADESHQRTEFFELAKKARDLVK